MISDARQLYRHPISFQTNTSLFGSPRGSVFGSVFGVGCRSLFTTSLPLLRLAQPMGLPRFPRVPVHASRALIRSFQLSPNFTFPTLDHPPVLTARYLPCILTTLIPTLPIMHFAVRPSVFLLTIPAFALVATNYKSVIGPRLYYP